MKKVLAKSINEAYSQIITKQKLPIKSKCKTPVKESVGTYSMSDLMDGDGWNRDILDDIGLMDALESIEKATYMLRNSTHSHFPLSELIAVLHDANQSFTQALDVLQDIDPDEMNTDPDDVDDN